MAVALGPLVGGAVAEGSPGSGSSGSTCPVGLAAAAARAAQCARATARPEARPRRASCSRPPACSASSGVSCAANGHGWTSPAVAGGARRSAPCCWPRSWPGSCARPQADAAAALLPQRGVRGRQRGLAARCTSACSARCSCCAQFLQTALGLLAARGRAADAAVDRDADARRARSPARSRTASAGGRSWRSASRCRRSASAGSRKFHGGGRLPVAGRAVRHRGLGMGLFFAPVANVVLGAVRADEEGKASGATNAIREIGGVFGVAVLASISRSRRVRLAAGRQRRASSLAIGWGRPSSPSARSAALAIPGVRRRVSRRRPWSGRRSLTPRKQGGREAGAGAGGHAGARV